MYFPRLGSTQHQFLLKTIIIVPYTYYTSEKERMVTMNNTTLSGVT
jgi:hypothetical protein